MTPTEEVVPLLFYTLTCAFGTACPAIHTEILRCAKNMYMMKCTWLKFCQVKVQIGQDITMDVTERSERSHQRHNREHNDGKITSMCSLLGMPVRLSNGIADKNNNQTYIHR